MDFPNRITPKAMMADIPLTRNFRLYEFIDAHPLNSAEFRRIAWENIDEFDIQGARRLANFLQGLRGHINREFKNKDREIGLKLTSAFRPKAWELMQNRDGSSTHTLSIAGDIQPVNCSMGLAVKILQHLHDIHWDLREGFQGGFAIRRPEYNEKGKLIRIGFAHYDFGRKRRWYY